MAFLMASKTLWRTPSRLLRRVDVRNVRQSHWVETARGMTWRECVGGLDVLVPLRRLLLRPWNCGRDLLDLGL